MSLKQLVMFVFGCWSEGVGVDSDQNRASGSPVVSRVGGYPDPESVACGL